MAEWHRIITSPYTGSMSMTGSFNVDGDATITGNVTINGTASVENLVVKQIGYSSGSNQLGDAVNDVQTLYGTVRIPTGSLIVTGSANITNGNLRLTDTTATIFLGQYGAVKSSDYPNVYLGFDANGTVVSSQNTIYLKTGNTNNGATIWVNSGTVFGTGNDNAPNYKVLITGSAVSGSLNANNTLYVSGSNVGIGTSTPSVALNVIGHFVQNAGGYGIATNTLLNSRIDYYQYAGHQFRSWGPAGSQNVVTITGQAQRGKVGIMFDNPTASLHVAGDVYVSASAGTGSALTVYKSGSTVVDVQGSSGQLFSITDSLSGSLFSVNTAAGLPTIEAFSDNTVNIGKYGSYPIKVVSLGTSAVVSGSFSGSGANLSGIPASAIVGLNLSQIATGSVSASVGLGTGSFQITSGSSNFFFVSSSGNVGIGTTTPAYTLDVSGSGRFTNGLTNTGSLAQSGSSTFYGGTYLFKSVSSGDGGIQIGTTINGYTGIDWISNNVGFGLIASGGITAKVNSGMGFNVGTAGTTSLGAMLGVKGSGTTSSTTSFLVQNSAGTNLLQLTDDNQINLGNTSASSNARIKFLFPSSGASGNGIFWSDSTTTNYTTDFGSITLSRGGGQLDYYTGTSYFHRFLTLGGTEVMRIGTGYNANIGIRTTTPQAGLHIATNTVISGSAGTNTLSIGTLSSGSALTVYKSGSTVVDIQGSQGSLMSVEDSLTGSLMSVGNISGLPLMEVFDDGTMNAGKFNVYPIKIVATGSQAVITGSFTGSFAGSINASAFTASSALVTGNVTVLGTASINNLVVNQIGYSSGSNQLGDAANDTQTLYGTVVIPTGSLTVSGSTSITGSLTVAGTSTLQADTVVRGSNSSGGTYNFQVQSSGGGFQFGVRADGFIQFNTLSPPAGTLNLTDGASLSLSGGGPLTGTQTKINASHLFQVSSGGNTFTVFGASPTINQTGTASGITRGLYINPTLTSAPNWRSIEWSNNTGWGLYGVGTAGNFLSSSLSIGTTSTGSALNVYKSGSTVFRVEGSQGELFAVTDSLSGSLFSVSNVSGLPILEVFSDNTVLLGSYLDPMLITTQRLTANSGSTVIYSLPTASYDGVFVDYVIRSGSNARAGQFMGLWSGSSANFTDSSTTDFGDTTGFVFGLIISGSNMVLTGSASTSTWTVRAGIRSI